KLRPPVFIGAGLRVVAAWHHDHDIGVECLQLLPLDARAVLAKRSEAIDAAGDGDHLGHPMSGIEWRRQPFQTSYLGRLPLRPGADLLDPVAECAGQIARALLTTGGAADGV